MIARPVRDSRAERIFLDAMAGYMADDYAMGAPQPTGVTCVIVDTRPAKAKTEREIAEEELDQYPAAHGLR